MLATVNVSHIAVVLGIGNLVGPECASTGTALGLRTMQSRSENFPASIFWPARVLGGAMHPTGFQSGIDGPV